MDKDQREDAALDALFSAAKTARPAPSADLMARLAGDADAQVPRTAPRPRHVHRAGWLKGLFTATGLSGAAVLGVWIGFVMPEALDTFSLTSDDTVALSTFLPGADLSAAFSE